MNRKSMRISFVGSGNVATRLCHAFRDANVEICQVLSSSATGKELAEIFNIERVTSPESLKYADVILLCIRDDALKREFLTRFDKNLFLCHTSGSIPVDVFDSRPHAGVFYPLQTLSKTKDVDFSNIPLCLESKKEKDLQTLQILANAISQDVRFINSDARLNIHLAAVFVSNFVNHLYKIADDLLAEQHISFDILQPLIKETAEKIYSMTPNDAQTGPALRKDNMVINKHIKLLNSFSDYQEIYKIISKSIAKHN